MTIKQNTYKSKIKESVVLVDEGNNPIGKMYKSTVHTSDTPLHRGFSVFIFNNLGELLIQQRSSKKITWPLVWSNSCCGHPAPGESDIEAVKRRVKFELGVNLVNLQCILPDYRYKAEHLQIVENEFCPVFVAMTFDKTSINTDEVEKVKWLKWKNFLSMKDDPTNLFSQWCREEADLLEKSNEFKIYLRQVLQKPIADEEKSQVVHKSAK